MKALNQVMARLLSTPASEARKKTKKYKSKPSSKKIAQVKAGLNKKKYGI